MRRRIGILTIVLVIIGLSGLAIKYIQEGLGHELPMLKLQEARQHWQEGLASQALLDFVSAYTMALNCGLRYAIARPYTDQMQMLQKEGRLREAWDTCIQAVEILDGWDQEGVVSYDCDVLEYRLRCTVIGDQMVCPPGIGTGAW